VSAGRAAHRSRNASTGQSLHLLNDRCLPRTGSAEPWPPSLLGAILRPTPSDRNGLAPLEFAPRCAACCSLADLLHCGHEQPLLLLIPLQLHRSRDGRGRSTREHVSAVSTTAAARYLRHISGFPCAAPAKETVGLGSCANAMIINHRFRIRPLLKPCEAADEAPSIRNRTEPVGTTAPLLRCGLALSRGSRAESVSVTV
jgi:hypothetical protein